MGHATTIRDTLLELEQAAQRLTQWLPDAPLPAPQVIAGENERALPLGVPLPNLRLEGQCSVTDMVAGIAMRESGSA